MSAPSDDQQTARAFIFLEITDLVRAASRDGGTLNAGEEAARVLAQHPHCGWSLDELLAMIATKAANAGAALEMDFERPAAYRPTIT